MLVDQLRVRIINIFSEVRVNKLKVIVCESRTFNNYKFLKKKMDKILPRFDNVEIVSGGCKGPDKLCEKYAEQNDLDKTVFKPNWEEYGKSAGPIRNSEMADYADATVAFWNGQSSGTKDMIKKSKNKDLQLRIIEV